MQLQPVLPQHLSAGTSHLYARVDGSGSICPAEERSHAYILMETNRRKSPGTYQTIHSHTSSIRTSLRRLCQTCLSNLIKMLASFTILLAATAAVSALPTAADLPAGTQVDLYGEPVGDLIDYGSKLIPAGTVDGCGSFIQVNPTNFTQGECQSLHSWAVGLYQKADQTCSFNVYYGQNDCINRGKSAQFFIPAGDGQLCVTSKIFVDNNREASGIYTCNGTPP